MIACDFRGAGMTERLIARVALCLFAILTAPASAVVRHDDIPDAGYRAVDDAIPVLGDARGEGPDGLKKGDAFNAASVTQVEVTYGWASVFGTKEEHVTLTPSLDRYELTGTAKEVEGPLPPTDIMEASLKGSRKLEDVTALADALLAPAVSEADAMERATDAFMMGDCHKRLRRSDILIAMRRYYEGNWTDDYPSFAVTVTFRDGRKVTATSRAKANVPLPWIVDGITTWNQAIPIAVGKLMPVQSLSRDRLAYAVKPDRLAWGSFDDEGVQRRIQRLKIPCGL